MMPSNQRREKPLFSACQPTPSLDERYMDPVE
jgi:hypothetical protein